MWVDSISSHCKMRSSQRVGISIDDNLEEDYVIDCVNNKSVFIEEQPNNRALLLSMIYDRFYVTVVNLEDDELITIMYANSGNRRVGQENFEKVHYKNLDDPDVLNFCNWRAKVLKEDFWNFTPPPLYSNSGKRYGPKWVLLWGGKAVMAIWDGYVWTDSNGNELDNHHVWGWKEIKAYENQHPEVPKLIPPKPEGVRKEKYRPGLSLVWKDPHKPILPNLFITLRSWDKDISGWLADIFTDDGVVQARATYSKTYLDEEMVEKTGS